MANIYLGDQAIGTVAAVLNTADATATAADILKDKTAYVGNDKITGTMNNNGAVSQTLAAGGSYTIPEGYHNGGGKVTAQTLAAQTDGTATATQILSGQTAYVDGVKVTGTMANNGAVSSAINAGGSYTIPAGYHNGSGKVTGNSLASQTSATAAAGDIASGKTAWVNGAKVTGNASLPTKVSVSIDTSELVRDTMYCYNYNHAKSTLAEYLKVSGVTPGKAYLVYYGATLIGYAVCYYSQRIYIYSVGYISTSGELIPVKDLTFYQL